MSEKTKKKQQKEFNFAGDYFISQILCDMCDFGKSGECTAEPPCKTYKAVEDNADL